MVSHEDERKDCWHCNSQGVSLKQMLRMSPVIQSFGEEVIIHISFVSLIFEDAYVFLNNLHVSWTLTDRLLNCTLHALTVAEAGIIKLEQ